MFEQIPVEAWLLLAIAAAAYAPVRYIYDYITHSPARQDITRPAEVLPWRTSGLFARNLAVLGGCAALAVFIFTPAARQLARSPSLLPSLIVGCGTWALVTVARGLSNGHIQPFVRGFHVAYERQSQPKRFWASMVWNTCFGCTCLWLVAPIIEQALEERCYAVKDTYLPQEQLSACDQLLDKHNGEKGKRADLMAAKGAVYLKSDDYRHAEAAYKQAIFLNPSDYESYFHLAFVENRQGNRVEAIKHYGEAIRLGPNDTNAYLNRGLIFLDGGRFDEAVADFTQAHDRDPANPFPLANRGIAYAWKRDQARAERDFAAARKLDPSNPVILRGEALLSMGKGDPDTAIAWLTAALRLDSGDLWSLGMRAEAYRWLGQTEKMQADLDERERLSRNPDGARR